MLIESLKVKMDDSLRYFCLFNDINIRIPAIEWKFANQQTSFSGDKTIMHIMISSTKIS